MYDKDTRDKGLRSKAPVSRKLKRVRVGHPAQRTDAPSEGRGAVSESCTPPDRAPRRAAMLPFSSQISALHWSQGSPSKMAVHASANVGKCSKKQVHCFGKIWCEMVNTGRGALPTRACGYLGRRRTATHRGHSSLWGGVVWEGGTGTGPELQREEHQAVQASNPWEGPAQHPIPLTDRSPSLCLQQHRDPGTGGHCSPFSSPRLAHWASVRVETLLSSKLMFKTAIMSTASPGREEQPSGGGRKGTQARHRPSAAARSLRRENRQRGRPRSRPLSRQQRNPLKAPLTGLPN